MGKFPFRRPRIISKKFPEIDSHIDSVTESLDRLVFAYNKHVDRTLQKKHWLMGVSSVVLLLVLGSFISQYGRADSTVFHPETCLGGWINPRNAEGEPETTSNGDPSQFTESNSAILPKNTNADIYCGNFRGEVDQATTPTKILVSLALTPGKELLLETTIQGETFASSTQEILDMASTTEVSFTLTGSSTESASSTVPVISTTTQAEGEAVATSSVPEPGKEAVTVIENIVDFVKGSINVLFETTKNDTQAETDTVVIPPQTDPSPAETAPEQTPVQETGTEAAPVSQKGWANSFAALFFDRVLAQEITVEETATVEGGNETPEDQPVAQEATEEVLVQEDQKVEQAATEVTAGTESLLQEVAEAASSTEVSSTTEEILSQIASSTLPMEATTTESSPSNDTEFQNNFLEVFYTFNGYTWESLGELNEISMKYRTFEIPVSASTSWKDLDQLQIKITSKKHLDENPTVYLDGMKVEVLYETTLAHVHPDFARDTILKDEIVDGVRIVTIINNDTNQEEIWYMHIDEVATSTSSETTTTVATSTGVTATTTEMSEVPNATSSNASPIQTSEATSTSATSTDASSTAPLIKPVVPKNRWLKLDAKVPQGAGVSEILEEIRKEEQVEEKLDERKNAKPNFALDTIKRIQGTLLKAIVVHVEKESGNELWVYNIVDNTEEKVGTGTTTVSSSFPLGVKGGYVFWLSEGESTLYAYDLSAKAVYEAEVPPFDGAEGKRAEVTIEGIPWKVIIGATGFAFYSRETGEVFSDDNSVIAEAFRRKLELDRLLDIQELNDLNLQTDIEDASQ